MGKITDLRKSGQLKEAWLEAAMEFKQRPDNVWIAREFAWVIYDCMKRYTDRSSQYFEDMDAYVKCLARARTLPLSSDEAMFFENAGKNVRFVVWELAKKKDDAGAPALRKLLGEIAKWPTDAQLLVPGVIRGLSKGLSSDPHSIVELFDWYGLDHFRPEDFEKKEVNGRKVLSDAESMTHGYLKALQSKDWNGNLEFDEQTLLRGVAAAKSLLANPRCEDWQWPPYSLGELLVAMGRHEDAMSFLAPMVVEKPREPWTWHAFGQSIKSKSDEAYAKCLFMGLLVSREVKMSLSLHEEALSFFVNKGMNSQAKAEAMLIDACRRENGWALSELASRVLRNPDYNNAPEETDLKRVYASESEGAADYLSEFVPKTDFYLEWADKDKGSLGIVTLKTAQSKNLYRSALPSLERNRAFYNGKLSVLPVGETCSAIFDKRKKYIIGSIEINEQAQIRSYVLREGFGVLDLFENVKKGSKSYFVRMPATCERDDAFVPVAIAEKEPVPPGNLVSFRERLVFRRNKKPRENENNNDGEWRWETFAIEDEGAPTSDNLANVPTVEFYVEWINKDRDTAFIAVNSPEQRRFNKSAHTKCGNGLQRKRISNKFVTDSIDECSVYRGRIFGKVRETLIGPIEKIDTGALYDKVIRKGIEGLYETSNGWGHIGCQEDISIPPKQTAGHAIANGSRVRTDAHLAYFSNRNKKESSNASDSGRWEWRASSIEVVAPPEERMASGKIRIAAAGFGLFDFNDDGDDGTCFVPQDLVQKYELSDDDKVEAEIRRSWDRKRKTESWIATEIVHVMRADSDLIDLEWETNAPDELSEEE